MVDEEVESVLNEIRERVRAQPVPPQPRISRPAVGNGAGDLNAELAQRTDITPAESLALIAPHLTTTARAWDRLPPLVSNRTGTLARIELSLKEYFKRATRWFTWEQVNFNAAVHHALRDTLRTLSAYEQDAARIREDLEALRLELKQQSEMAAQVATQLITPIATQLARELREGDERLQDEQRVCFKQLALEATETTVIEDRARRKTEALLEELTRRVEELEKG